MKKVFCDHESCLIAPYLQAPPIVCTSWAEDDGPVGLTHIRDPKWSEMWLRWLSDPEVLFVAQNAKFEFITLLAQCPRWRGLLFSSLKAGRWSCTMVREKLLRIGKGDRTEGYALDDLAEEHVTGFIPDKTSPWRLRFGTFIDVPVAEWPQEAVDYAKGDICVREIWASQAGYGDEYFVNEAAQVEADVFLGLSSAWGLATDLVQAAKLVVSTEADITQAQQLLVAEGLVRANGTKDKKAAEARMEAVCVSQGRDVPRGEVTEKMASKGVSVGNIKLDAEACLASGDPVLVAYTTYSQANTLLSKAKRLLFPVIQPSYNVLVNSGRTSCRQGEDPKPGQAWIAHGSQIQNPPRKEGMRECFVARPGRAIVSIDYDQAELRTWAQCCIDLGFGSEMGKVLNDPTRDVHAEQGAAIAGVPAATMYGWKKSDPKQFKKYRQMAKAVVFGAPGGLGAKTFVEFARGTYGLTDLTEGDARELIDLWKTTWPEAGKYLEYISSRLPRKRRADDRPTTTVKHFISNRLRGKVGFCDYANTLFQGRAADAAKAGFCAVGYEMYNDPTNPLFGSRMLAFVHDEILLEIPLVVLHEAAFRARDMFVLGALPYVKDVPMTATPTAMLRWTKNAETVYDANGKLIPWVG